jgi:hypothetical protein
LREVDLSAFGLLWFLDLAGELMEPQFDAAELTWPGALPPGWYAEWEPAADPADRGE